MVNVLNACPFNLKDGKERILWEITPRCNMNCKHCLFYMGNGKKCSDEITMEQAFEIIDNIKKDKSMTDDEWLYEKLKEELKDYNSDKKIKQR